MQKLIDQVRDLLPAAGPLDKRTTSRLKPVLEDLLEALVLDLAGKKDDGLDFQGRVNIALLKAGVQDFFVNGVDFDHNVAEETLTVTAIWTFPGLHSAVVVDILFKDKP